MNLFLFSLIIWDLQYLLKKKLRLVFNIFSVKFEIVINNQSLFILNLISHALQISLVVGYPQILHFLNFIIFTFL